MNAMNGGIQRLRSEVQRCPECMGRRTDWFGHLCKVCAGAGEISLQAQQVAVLKTPPAEK